VDFSKVGFKPTAPFTWEQRRWTWTASAMHLNTQASLTAVPTNGKYLTGIEHPPVSKPAEGEARDFSEQYSYSLDFWWVYLYYLGSVSARAALVLGAMALSAAALAAWNVRRVLARIT